MNYKNFKCPICGQKDFEVLRKRDDKMINTVVQKQDLYSSSSNYRLFDQLVNCSTCDHVMTNPRINTSDLISKYSNAIDDKHHMQDKFRINSFSYALKRITNTLDINTEDSNINLVDIGCASGAFLYAATKLTKWKVQGVEPSLKLVEYGKKEYDVLIKQGIFKVEDHRDTKIDIITLWDVLEHINEPDLMLEEISETLVNGGYLIINVPNLNSLFARFLGYSWPFYLAVHIHYFKNQTIKRILKKQNFEICYKRAYFQQLGLGYILHRIGQSLNLKFKYNRINKILDTIPVWYNMGQTTFVAKK